MCINGTVCCVYKVKSPCLVTHPAMKAYGGMEDWPCAFLILALYLDSVFHALASLSLGQALLVLIVLLGFRTCLDTLERRKNSLPMLGIKPCLPSHPLYSLVTAQLSYPAPCLYVLSISDRSYMLGLFL